jgi:hypothetical protein
LTSHSKVTGLRHIARQVDVDDRLRGLTAPDVEGKPPRVVIGAGEPPRLLSKPGNSGVLADFQPRSFMAGRGRA